MKIGCNEIQSSNNGKLKKSHSHRCLKKILGFGMNFVLCIVLWCFQHFAPFEAIGIADHSFDHFHDFVNFFSF